MQFVFGLNLYPALFVQVHSALIRHLKNEMWNAYVLQTHRVLKLLPVMNFPARKR